MKHSTYEFKKRRITWRRFVRWRLAPLRYYLLACVLLEILGALVLAEIASSKRDRYFVKELERVRVAYSAILNTYEQVAHTVYDELIALPEVISLLKSHPDTAHDAYTAARAQALQRLKPRYYQLWGQHVNILECHLADGTTALALQNPLHDAERQSEPRYAVEVVANRHIIIKGFEITTQEVGFRYLFPVLSAQEYLGTIEIGISIDGLRQELEHLFMREMLFMFRRDQPGDHVNPGDYESTPLSEDYLRDTWNVFVHESSDTIERLDTGLSQSIGEKLAAERSFVVHTHLEERDFLVTFLAIEDIQHHHAGYLISYGQDATVQGYIEEAYWNFLGFSGLVFGMLLAVYSVRRSKAFLAQREKRFQQITHSLNEGLCVLDVKQRMTFVNPAAQRLLGYTQQELIGMPFYVLMRYHTQEGERLRGRECPVYEAIEIQRAYTSDDHLLKTQHRGDTPVALTSAPLRAQDRIEGTVVVFRDISQRKQAEEQLQLMNQQLKEASQHKSDFLSSMSHELRTPLNAMIGYTSLTLSVLRKRIAPEYLRHLIKAEQSARILLELINDVLDFSKIEAGRMEAFIEEINIVDILEDVLITAEGLMLEKPILLKPEIDGELPPIQSDYTKMKQILNNLVGNAMKFTTEGWVAVRTIPLRDRHILRIEIEDTGCGVSGEKLDRIFESFQQADGSIKKRFGGTGLGLAITKKLCDMLNIEIGVQSEVDTGTLFWLHIPVHFEEGDSRQRGRAVEMPEHVPQQAAPLPSQLSILIVDDNATNLDLLGTIFEMEGFTVYKAGCGREALRMAEAEHPDVVLMDLAMPDMDGFEATRRLKQHPQTAQLPVIACSALVNQHYRQQAIEVGCEGYIHKPIEPHHLVEQVSKLLLAATLKQGATTSPCPTDFKHE